jgi:hypothetical protein
MTNGITKEKGVLRLQNQRDEYRVDKLYYDLAVFRGSWVRTVNFEEDDDDYRITDVNVYPAHRVIRG